MTERYDWETHTKARMLGLLAAIIGSAIWVDGEVWPAIVFACFFLGLMACDVSLRYMELRLEQHDDHGW